MANPLYKLTYFNGRGRGECIRQLFALAGVKYEDYRVERKDWPAVKSHMPFGQMPVLEVDGKELAQSYAICRYLAKKFGFAGKDDFEQAQVDAAADQFKDYSTELRPYAMVLIGFAEGDLEKLKADVLRPTLQKHLPLFTKLIKNSGSGFLVGQNVTWADLQLSEHTWSIQQITPEELKDFPEIVAHANKVRSIPALKKWLESRPETAF